MNGTSLFSNIGVAEFFLEENGISIVVANEIEKKRAEIYSYFYPKCNMIVGDIWDSDIFDKIIEESKKNNCEFLIATPPCQGMSIAGKRNYESDTRNSLIIRVFDYIKKVSPKYIIIENVEQQLNTIVEYNGEKKTIQKHLVDNFSKEYYFNDDPIINTRDFAIPQNRKRAIILMCKIQQWNFPKREAKEVTVKDVIGHLPSLTPLVKEEFLGDNRKLWIYHKYHYPSIHPKRHIEAMLHTPTGKSAFDNDIYFPKKTDGTKIKGYNTTYKRMRWDTVAPTITTANGVLSSQCNVHPGNEVSNGIYDNARVLSLFEIILLMTIPNNINLPENYNENLIRKTIGEGIPPLLIKKIISTLPKK
jgi:modification methylase hgaIA